MESFRVYKNIYKKKQNIYIYKKHEYITLAGQFSLHRVTRKLEYPQLLSLCNKQNKIYIITRKDHRVPTAEGSEANACTITTVSVLCRNREGFSSGSYFIT